MSKERPDGGREVLRLDDMGGAIAKTRIFTVAEANALLPELRHMLARLREIHDRVQTEFIRMERSRARGYTREGNVIRLYDERAERQRLERVIAEGNRIILEIRRMGCELKDIEEGMVDFPSELDGRPIVLCWRHDEPWVMYYHEPGEGAAGRKPLPAHAR